MDQLQTLMTDFGVNLPKLLAQVILFLILYFTLNKLAFGPIIKVLEERRRRIEEAQENAEKVKQQLADAKKHYEEIIQKANAEGQHLIDQARESAEALAEKKAQEAIVQAENIIAKANAETEIARNKMETEVRQKMVNLVVDTTAKVTGKVLTPADQERLNSETTAQLAA
jgi:F-type H+-transporting ATPase subunit b